MAHNPTYPVGSNYRDVGGALDVVGGKLLIEALGVLGLGSTINVTITAANQAVFTGVPTADPHVVGALWANAGVLTLSAG